MKVISRKQALQEASTRYFTGNPCKNGHIAERITSSYDCLDCHKQRYYDRHNYENNRLKTWKKDNPRRDRAHKSAHRAAKLRATPKWVDTKALMTVYLNCPNGYQVDHIYPLQGENVCGLHIPENLQYLTAEENNRKGNRVYVLASVNGEAH